jgi:hypothetical protein
MKAVPERAGSVNTTLPFHSGFIRSAQVLGAARPFNWRSLTISTITCTLVPM